MSLTNLLILSACSLLVCSQLSANSVIEFEGRWCGKWDNIYQTCFTIKKSEQGYKTLYQWEEHPGGGFQEKFITGKQLNANTLDFKGKIIVIDLKQPDSATALGVFQHHSRTAKLKLQKDDARKSRHPEIHNVQSTPGNGR